MTVSVRRATPGDANETRTALLAIHRRLSVSEAMLGETLGDPDFVLLLAKLSDADAGYLHAQVLNRSDGNRMLLVYDVEVAAACRRRGVASSLMDSLMTLAAERSISDVWLVTEPDNEPAASLYESLGGKLFPAVGYEWDLQ